MTEITDPSAEGELRRIPVADITAEDAFNPRSSFDRRELEALAASVAQHGVLTPITVGPHNGSGYRLIAGERRLRAARDSGLAEIPAVVRQVDDHTAGLDLALVENIARADLTPLDEARAFARLIDSGLTRKGVAERLSLPQRRVTERLQVLELPETLHDPVGEGVIPPGAIRALVVLAKIDPELAELAVAKVAAGPAQPWDQPLTWSDVAQDPIAAVGSDYDGEQSAMPAHIYQPHVAYPVGRFCLSEKAAKHLAQLSELRGVQPDAHRLSFRGEDVDAAEALGAVHRSCEGHVALIVGQQVADQLAGDAIGRALTKSAPISADSVNGTASAATQAKTGTLARRCRPSRPRRRGGATEKPTTRHGGQRRPTTPSSAPRCSSTSRAPRSTSGSSRSWPPSTWEAS